MDKKVLPSSHKKSNFMYLSSGLHEDWKLKQKTMEWGHACASQGQGVLWLKGLCSSGAGAG